MIGTSAMKELNSLYIKSEIWRQFLLPTITIYLDYLFYSTDHKVEAK